MVNSNASGTASLKLAQGESTNILSISGTYQGLSGPATAAHWHGLDGPAIEAEDGAQWYLL